MSEFTINNLQVKLKQRPKELPHPTETFEITKNVLRFDPHASSDVPKILVRNLFLSLDPAMRGWMKDVKSYVPPVAIGAVMRGGVVGEVVASQDPTFKEGDIVTGYSFFTRSKVFFVVSMYVCVCVFVHVTISE